MMKQFILLCLIFDDILNVAKSFNVPFIFSRKNFASCHNLKKTVRYSSINKSDNEENISFQANQIENEKSDIQYMALKNESESNDRIRAEQLKQKARELLDEAKRAEIELIQSRKEALETKNKYLDDILDEIINIVKQPTEVEPVDVTFVSMLDDQEESAMMVEVVNVLRRRHLSSVTMMNLVERIFERETIANENVFRMLTQSSPNDFVVGDVTNSVEFNQAELTKLDGWLDRLVSAQSILDSENGGHYKDNKRGIAPSLEARIRELKRQEEDKYKRKLANKVNKETTLYNPQDGLDPVAVQTVMVDGNLNYTVSNILENEESKASKIKISDLMKELVTIPMWVPSSILPFVVTCREEVALDDLKKIKNEILPSRQVQVINWDFMKFGAVYRLNILNKKQSIVSVLSGTKERIAKSEANDFDLSKQNDELKSLEHAFAEINRRLESSGLADKVQLFLLEDPEWRPGQTREPEPLPVILAVSSGVVPEQGKERGNIKKFITAMSVVSSIFTTFVYAVTGYALNPKFFDSVVNKSDVSALWQCIPIMLGIFVVNLIHELAHAIAAKATKTQIGLPVPLPSLQIGSFGAITPFRSFPRDRAAMFDVAMSGPVASFLTSIVMMITGFLLTIRSSTEQISTLATVPAALMKTSLLVGWLTSIFAPKILLLSLSQPIAIHPLFLAGFTGIIFSALNLLPIGRLDGGRACQSVFGRRNATFVSFSSLLFLAIAALTGSSTISIFWGLLVTLFQRNLDVPVRDDWSEVDNVRLTVFLMMMLLTITTLIPFPGGDIL